MGRILVSSLDYFQEWLGG